MFRPLTAQPIQQPAQTGGFRPITPDQSGALLQNSQTLSQSVDEKSAETTGALFPAETGESPVTAGLKAVGNVPTSLYGLGKGIVSAVAHPVKTIKGIAESIGGGLTTGAKALGIPVTETPQTKESEQTFSNLTQSLKDRYGSLENLQRTATNDPAGFGADVLSVIGGGAGLAGKTTELGELASMPGKMVEYATGKLSTKASQELEKASLRMTPTQKLNFKDKIDGVASYLADKNIIGSPETRLGKINTIYDGMENKLQEATYGKGIVIPKNEVIDSVKSLKSKYKNDRDSVAINRQIDDAVNTIKSQPTQIPFENLNEFKRSTYKGAFNKAGTKVSDAVERDIGDVMRTKLDKAVSSKGITIDGKTLNDFNKEYGTVITARDLLETASVKPQIGGASRFISRILGASAGYMLGGGLGGEVLGGIVAPTVAEGLAGTVTKSIAGSGLKKIGNRLVKQALRPSEFERKIYGNPITK